MLSNFIGLIESSIADYLPYHFLIQLKEEKKKSIYTLGSLEATKQVAFK